MTQQHRIERRMFIDFFTSYERIIHRDFVPMVDAKNGRITTSFAAELIDAGGRTALLRSTNFWRLRESDAGTKFQEVYVYMSGANVLV
jgi:hypothetical protein